MSKWKRSTQYYDGVVWKTKIKVDLVQLDLFVK